MAATCALALAVSVPALAQPQPAGGAAPTSSGQLTIERVEQGFVFAPDARVTEVNGETAALAGGYAGWMTDRTWLVGAGGYWLANHDDDLEMAYGGLVLGYLARGHERVGFGVGGLVGAGRATLGGTVGEYVGLNGDIGLPMRDRWRGGRGGRGLAPIVADTDILVRESFFVFEPQASVVFYVTRWARLDLGLGYRVTSGAGRLDEDLRGPSASVAVQFGRAKQ